MLRIKFKNGRYTKEIPSQDPLRVRPRKQKVKLKGRGLYYCIQLSLGFQGSKLRVPGFKLLSCLTKLVTLFSVSS